MLFFGVVWIFKEHICSTRAFLSLSASQRFRENPNLAESSLHCFPEGVDLCPLWHQGDLHTRRDKIHQWVKAKRVKQLPAPMCSESEYICALLGHERCIMMVSCLLVCLVFWGGGFFSFFIYIFFFFFSQREREASLGNQSRVHLHWIINALYVILM